jgi:hypothetical protein
VLKVWTNVPELFTPLSNDPSSAVTECCSAPLHVNVTDWPAVIVVVEEFGLLPSWNNVSGPTVTLPPAAATV